MSTTSGSARRPVVNTLPAWTDCDLFCIQGYARRESACGWRGRYPDAPWDGLLRVRRCPRCGGATLLEIGDASVVPAEARSTIRTSSRQV